MRIRIPWAWLLCAVFVFAAPSGALAGINEWSKVGATPVDTQWVQLSPAFASDGVMFVGGVGRVNTHDVRSRFGMARSVNSGTTWTTVSGGQLDQVSAMTLAPDFTATSGLAIAGTGQETGARLFSSVNGGVGWNRITGAPAGLGRVDDVAFSPAFATDRNVWALHIGTDALGISQDAGVTWNHPNRAFGGTHVTVALQGSGAVVAGYTEESSGGSSSRQGAVLRSADAGQRWTTSAAAGTPVLVDIDFLDNTTAFALGEGGAIYRTVDAGVSWSKVATAPISPDVGEGFSRENAIDMVDANVGWVADRSGMVCRTTNGGVTWTDVTPMDPWGRAIFELTDLAAGSGQMAVAVAREKVLVTTDAGVTWNDIVNDPDANPGGPLPNGAWYSGVDFTDANHVWVIGRYLGVGGSGSVICRSTDGGASWQTAAITDAGSQLQHISFADALHGIAVGSQEPATMDGQSSGLIAKTSDGGQTWTTRTDASTSGFDDVSLGAGGLGLALAPLTYLSSSGDSPIVKTTDGGLTWRHVNQGLAGSLPDYRGPYTLAVSPGFASDRTLLANVDRRGDYSTSSVPLSVSRDGGWNWDDMTIPGASGGLASVQFSPTYVTDGTLFAIVTDSSPRGGSVWRSTDRGATWTRVFGPLQYLIEEWGPIRFSPAWASDHTAYFIGAGLLHKTVDGGAHWYGVGAKTLEMALPLAVNPGTSGSAIVYGTVVRGASYQALSPDLWSYTFGPPRKARPSHVTAYTAVDGLGKFIGFSGTLAPGHPRQPYVYLYVYRKVNGHWVQYTRLTCAVWYTYNDTYEIRLRWNKIPVGSYYVKAYHADTGDGGHLATWSSPTYFTRAATYSSWRK
jgi:photosystem II stability/assembly factor-like uncharacterized protein